MGKSLERDLGLYATTMISVGAMIGSGIFVLPGLAFKIVGPAVILAFVLAGLVALPAVLSKAEMATAMPEAGGTYLYIDRSMGPLLGTIAGVGAWFSLTFKSAFALVGLGAYLVLFSALPPKLVALGLAVLLLIVNIGGVKQTGRFQSLIVSVVFAVLILFIGDGITFVDSTQYHPFFPEGRGSLLAATGFVFVSYAGVTKIASVAEEVENPSQNIPLAMLISVILMMLVYAMVVFVMVGVSPPGMLRGTLRPMAIASEQFLGDIGILLVGIIAVVALTSMANAGILSASRFPFAMSRDELAPPSIEYIHERFHTPVVALLLTGAILFVLVGFVPVLELAKLASAFKILVFSLVNVALIAFRESGLESYDPEFIAPGYPWVQLFGLVAGVVLLTQMGLIPLLGAIGIILGGIGWYRIYGRERTEREGAAIDAIRRSIGDRALAQTEQQALSRSGGNVLVLIGPETSSHHERTLLRVASHVASHWGGSVHAVLFEEVPEQRSLTSAADERTEADRIFERQTEGLRSELRAPVEVTELVSHDARRAVINHAEDIDASLLIGEVSSGRFRGEVIGHDIDWFMNHAPCDVVFVRHRDLETINEIAVLAQRGPHGPLKTALASAIAADSGATVRLVTLVDKDASDEQIRGIEAFHEDLKELCDARTVSEIIKSDQLVESLVESTADADLAVVGHEPHSLLHDVVLSDLSTQLAEQIQCTVLLVHSRAPGTIVRRVIKRALF